jgi:uncharacterized protein (TIGR03000 family)
MKRITIKTGLFLFGCIALSWTAPSVSQAYFHGGCYHGGCWGCRGPFIGVGFYGGYPWYGYGYPYPYPYPYAYPYPYGYPYPGPPYPPGAAAPVQPAPVRVTVHVPPDADVWFNGNQTQQKGPVRQFMTPPIADGNYKYEIRAAWRVDGQLVTLARTVAVRPGINVDVDFAGNQPARESPQVAASSEEEIPSVFLPQPATQRFGPAAIPITVNAASSPLGQNDTLEPNLQKLSSPDDAVRQKAIMDLGRSGSIGAVAPLEAALTRDGSPHVRDAAARSLGLIADPRSLPALIRAAQADDDREVRHSAQFAVEVIRSRLRQN